MPDNNISYYDKGKNTITLDFSETEKIKNATNDYLLFLTIKWYLNNYDVKLAITDQSNVFVVPKFEPSRLLFFPLFYSTANGSSNSLFNTLKPIKEYKFGLYSENLVKRVFAEDKKSIFSVKDGRLNVEITTQSNSNGLIDIIENSIIQTPMTSSLNFKDIFIKKNNGEFCTIIDALKSSQKALELGIGSRFLNYSLKDFEEKHNIYKGTNKIHLNELVSL